jgi:hypothetical protein
VIALTDGLLNLRYYFGFRGAVLIAGAVGPCRAYRTKRPPANRRALNSKSSTEPER